MPDKEEDEIFLEYKQIGNIMRVTAIDAKSGTEIVFQAPLITPNYDLEKIAVRKLKYVMKKQQAQNET